MQTRLELGAAIVLVLSLTACNAPIPNDLTAPPPKLELATIPVEYTEAIEPTLAVEIAPDKLYVSTYFLHDSWREHLRKTFDKKRSEKHWFAARYELDEIYEWLDEDAPTWRKGRVEVADLHDGEVSSGQTIGEEEMYIPSLFDELREQVETVGHVGSAIDLADRWMHRYVQSCASPPCGPYPNSLLVVAHPDVPARTIRQVIHTASQAELDQRIQLLVNVDQPRVVPIATTRLSVGPPSEDETEAMEACAMVHMKRDDSLYLVFNRVQRLYDESLANLLGVTQLMVLHEEFPPYPNDAAIAADENWRSRPAWDDALLVTSEDDCRSGTFESVAQAKKRLERTIEGFDAAAVCKNAFFDLTSSRGPDAEQEMPLTAGDAVEAIAALRAVESVDNVFVSQRPDEQPATDQALRCARKYLVEVL